MNEQELVALLRAVLEHHDAAMARPVWSCACWGPSERAPHDYQPPEAIRRARAITGLPEPVEVEEGR